MALIPLNSQGNFDVAVTMPWDSSGKSDVLVDVLGPQPHLGEVADQAPLQSSPTKYGSFGESIVTRIKRA